MGDFEVYPFDWYEFNSELEPDEINNLSAFAHSFRETFFKEWESPRYTSGVWILKYNGTIIRDSWEVESIHDNIKILFLLLKLHVSHDFFNPLMNNIGVKTFDLLWFNVWSSLAVKFGNMSECKDLHSTVPENLTWLWNINFFPIQYCTNNIPVEFKMFWWWEQMFGVHSDVVDISELYLWILRDADYYKKFLNIASVHFWLEQQNDLFFYYSIIPSIIEVLIQPDSNDIKKQKAIDFWKSLDDSIVENNDKIDTLIYTKKNWDEVREELWIIARTFVLIYDLRNLLLHEWKKSFEKLKVEIHGVEVRIYDIFQLIFKYIILHDLIEKWILENRFIKVSIIWSPLTSLLTWEDFIVEQTWGQPLALDQELDWLIRKSESDRDLSLIE